MTQPLAPLGRTLRLALPAARRTTWAGLLGSAAVAADIGLIGAAAWLISRAAEHPNEASLALAIVAVQLFGLSRGLFRYGERLVGHDAAFRLLAALRVRAFVQLERLAPAGLPAFRRGDLLARLVGDVDALQDLVLRVIPAFLIAAVVGSLTIGVMWWLLPAAALVLALSLLLAATLLPWLIGFLARRKEARFAGARGDLAAAVLDLTEGAAELIAFGAADKQVRLIQERDAELTAIASATAGTAGLGSALTTLLTGLACWGCLLVGIPAVQAGHMDPTALAVVALVPLAAFELVLGLPGATQALHRTRQSAARVFDVLDAPPPVSERETPLARPDGGGAVLIDGVWASYPGAPAPAVRGVELMLPVGRRVAVVGPSGAGKSTLAGVLVRFLDVQAGTVLLDGTATDRLAADEVRSVIGLVAQDAYLFDTTIGENLRLGDREAGDDALCEVLARVGLTDWVDGLPLGLGTEVGPHGARLSGGQHRRLCVARALLADFPVLVLDEPAEHLDAAAADALTTDVLTVTEGRSLLLITHRLAGLEGVDEIVVLDDGRVIERGTHDALLAGGGRYAELWWEEMRTARFAPAAPQQLSSLQEGTRRP